ncbi:MAG: hypothetical protein OEW39_06565 [Deltaproteobacteria bacterium]|nr:hypothetical protein [Deltaproteobacteria bacterium]
MRLGRIMLLGWLTAAGLFPQGAFAQVAAPKMILGTPSLYESDALGLVGASVVPDNPALMFWSLSSEIDAGLLTVSRVSPDPLLGVSQTESGRHFGVRLHFNEMALGLESLDYKVIFPSNSYSVSQRNRALAIGVFDWLAFGFSYATADQTTDSAGAVQSDTLWSMTHSLSFKMAENYFLGVGVIQDHYLTQPSLSQASRNGYLAGLGYYGGSKPVAVHAEYSLYYRAPAHSVQGVDLGQGIRRGLAVLEVGYNLLVFGYSQSTVQRPERPEIRRGQIFSLGYAQAGNIAVTLRREITTLPVGALQERETITSLGLSYQFWGLKPNPNKT